MIDGSQPVKDIDDFEGKAAKLFSSFHVGSQLCHTRQRNSDQSQLSLRIARVNDADVTSQFRFK